MQASDRLRGGSALDGERSRQIVDRRNEGGRDPPNALRHRASTLRHDARGHDVRAVAYAWHPLYGREFAVEPHGNGNLFRCWRVEDRGVPCVLLPQWIFDPVACSVMREVSSPVSCLRALDELRWVLSETRAVDSLPAVGETCVHEQTTSMSTSRTGSTAFALPASGVEEPSGIVPQRGRRTRGQTSEAAREVEGRSRKTSRRKR